MKPFAEGTHSELPINQ